MALRYGVGEYDSAMVVCASQEEVEDLEEEDAAKIMALVEKCRSAMQVECMPLDQWNTDSDIVDKTTWIAQARAAFQEELDGVMACYMEDERRRMVGTRWIQIWTKS